MSIDLEKLEEIEEEYDRQDNMRMMIVFCGLSMFCILVRMYQVISIIYQQLGLQHSNYILHYILVNTDIKIPLTLIIDLMIVMTALYGGTETTISVIKSRSMPIGQSKPLPKYKKRRLYHMMNVWVTLSIGSTILYALLGKNEVTDFDLTEVYIGLFTVVSILLASVNANKVVEDTTTNHEPDPANMVANMLPPMDTNPNVDPNDTNNHSEW